MWKRAFTDRLAALVALLFVGASYLLAWWPSDFSDRTFWAYRRTFLDEFESRAWHNWFFVSYFGLGYAVQIGSVAVAAVVRSTARWWPALAGLAIVGCAWQVVGVRGATLIDTTIAPSLGIPAGLVLLVGLATGRATRKARKAREASSTAAT